MAGTTTTYPFLNIWVISANTPVTIQHVIYGEGTTPKDTYEGILNVLPDIEYSIKIEVLRNDLESSSERVSKIILNGETIGDCNPDGGDYDCTFFDCAQTLSTKRISSSDGKIFASLTYQGHARDCDCDKETWECVKENTKPGFTPMTAVARITLTPLNGN